MLKNACYTFVSFKDFRSSKFRNCFAPEHKHLIVAKNKP